MGDLGLEWGSKEYFEMMKEREEALSMAVSVKEGHIVINLGFEYNIPIATCDTAPRLLGWILQLSEKTWMNMEVLERFIYVAAREGNIDVVR